MTDTPLYDALIQELERRGIKKPLEEVLPQLLDIYIGERT